MSAELPEGGEWASIPLLDPSNVGKYVWPIWNGNRRTASTRPAKIIKIGRTNVHIDSNGTPWSLRVEDASGKAYGTRSGYDVSIETEQYRVEAEERSVLIQAIHRVPWGRLSTEALRKVLAAVQAERLL